VGILIFTPENDESRHKIDKQVKQSLSYGGASDRHNAAVQE